MWFSPGWSCHNTESVEIVEKAFVTAPVASMWCTYDVAGSVLISIFSPVLWAFMMAIFSPVLVFMSTGFTKGPVIVISAGVGVEPA